MSAEEIVRKSMKIAGDRCVYTNHSLVVEKIETQPAVTASSSSSPTAPSSSSSVPIASVVADANPASTV